MTGFNPNLQALGCCGAGCKEECTAPPCPCNMDQWSERELRQIRDAKRVQSKPKRGGS